MAEDLLKRLRTEEDYNKLSKGKDVYDDTNFLKTEDILVEKDKEAFWKHLGEIFGGEYKLLDNVDINDIDQGLLGDAYLMAPLGAVAEFPKRVEKMFLTKEVNKAGCYAVRLFLNGVPRIVTVDSYFPVDEKGDFIYASTNGNKVWPLIVEKAWAKAHGGYNKIEGGDPREGLTSLTGAPCDLYVHQKTARKLLWDTLFAADKENYIMVCGGAKEKLGLVSHHCYSLIKCVEIEMDKDKTEKLVQLRNPWASHEWQGEWGDKSAVWTEDLKQQLNHIPGEDGTFFMKFEDFCYYFAFSFVCKVVDSYVHSSLETTGKANCALISVEQEEKIFISAYQLTKRFGETITKDFKLGALCLDVFKVEEKSLKRIGSQRSNPIGCASLELTLAPGQYVLHGFFEVFAPSFPLINFITYAPSPMTLVDLKTDNIESIEVDSLKKKAKK